MTYDEQGRICLGRSLCKEFSYTEDMELKFTYEDERTYRLTPVCDISRVDKIVGHPVRLDQKYRLHIPKEIRDVYTKYLMVYGSVETGYLYVKFTEKLSDTNERTIFLLENIAKSLEEIAKKL